MSLDRTLFLADAHLQPGDRATQNRMLERFLEEAGQGACRLVILGDLFHCWFERSRQVVGDFRAILALFAAAAARGMSIDHVTGNRDFAIGAGRRDGQAGTWPSSQRYRGFYALAGNRAGSVLADHGIEPHGLYWGFEQDGRRVLCAHGDVWCSGDRGYVALRWLTQGCIGRLCMATGPFRLARLIVGWFQRMQVSRQPHYPSAGRGIVWERACRELASGADLVVCGHMHHAGRVPLLLGDLSGELVIVPAWCAGFAYAELQAGEPGFRVLGPSAAVRPA